MGTYDISRVVFDPKKHYASVRMQQGRVLTDDDWNENERIENEEQRRTRVDVIGPAGSPDDGFRIDKTSLDTSSGFIDFRILPGTFYLGGLQLELEDQEKFRRQSDLLLQPAYEHAAPQVAAGEVRYDLVYLEAWQQPVSAVEDEELLEKALGGPDTTTRVRNMRRVHLFEDVQTADCAEAWQKRMSKWLEEGKGKINEERELLRDVQLAVGYLENGKDEDLCTPSVQGGYLGAENQAIRVQLLENGRFTWGVDNAAPLYRVEVADDNKTVRLKTPPKDRHHWPVANQVVEVLPCSAVLSNGEKTAGLQGHLSKVETGYDPDEKTLTIATTLPAEFGYQLPENQDTGKVRPAHYYLRVWNRGTDLASAPEIAYVAGQAVPLGNTGVTVTITGNDRVAGDYWVIAARPRTPDKVVPWQLKEGAAPMGMRMFYAPLAIIAWRREGNAVKGEVVQDCRRKFQPLIDLETCCTYSVGDGQHSRGDFRSIQEAVDNLPERGGKVCILPGVYDANVVINHRRNIHISGCGERSIIRPPRRNSRKPVFGLQNSQNIRLEGLTIAAPVGTAIELVDAEGEISSNIRMTGNRIIAGKHAIKIHAQEVRAGLNEIYIGDNRIRMRDRWGGGAAIFSLADGVRIERNQLVTIPPKEEEAIEQIPRPGLPDRDEFGQFYERNFPLSQYLNDSFEYSGSEFNGDRVSRYRTWGGIQIGCASEQVQILDNEITGGRGNGITFGHLPEIGEGASVIKDRIFLYPAPEDNWCGFLYDIHVERNRIRRMGLSGIGVRAFFRNNEGKGNSIQIKDLSILGNVLTENARQLVFVNSEGANTEIPPEMNKQVGFGGIALSDVDNGVIRDNRIESNGTSHHRPVCGVFIGAAFNLDISGNHILNNGPWKFEAGQVILPGKRGGIVINYVSHHFLHAVGRPALKVQNNIVAQPMGPALSVVALGPVMAIGNQFTSRKINWVDSLSQLGGVTTILNLGLSKDLVHLGMATKFNNMQLANAMPKVLTNRLYWPWLQWFPPGSVLFSNNQANLDLRWMEGSITLVSNLITTLDDIAFNNNQLECTGFWAPGEGLFRRDMVGVNTFLQGTTTRANNNRFQEGTTLTLVSLWSKGVLNTTTGNQATRCIWVEGFPKLKQDHANMVINPINCQAN